MTWFDNRKSLYHSGSMANGGEHQLMKCTKDVTISGFRFISGRFKSPGIYGAMVACKIHTSVPTATLAANTYSVYGKTTFTTAGLFTINLTSNIKVKAGQYLGIYVIGYNCEIEVDTWDKLGSYASTHFTYVQPRGQTTGVQGTFTSMNQFVYPSAAIPTNTGSYALMFDYNGDANQPPTNVSKITKMPATDELTLTGETITLAWEKSTDPEGNAITYDVEFYNGSSWVSVGNTSALTINHKLPTLNIDNARYRIRAKDSNGNLSEYTNSNTFRICRYLALIQDKGKEKTFKDGSWQAILYREEKT